MSTQPARGPGGRPLTVRWLVGAGSRRVRWVVRSNWRKLSNNVQLLGWDRLTGPPTSRGVTIRHIEPPSDRAVPVVLCVWKRLDRLERTISLLEDQVDGPTELHIWNNDRRSRERVDEIARRSTKLDTYVTHSSRNIGGFGRFFLARELAGRRPYVVFIDDDLTFSTTMTSGLVSEWSPATIISQWSFRLLSSSDYDERIAGAPGESVDYCGTGGMVADTRIFSEPGFFSCPKRFWFVEDLWLSYYASHVLGWQLRKSGVAFEMDADGLDQSLILHRQKSALLRYLVRQGWSVPRRLGTAPQAGQAQQLHGD